MKLEPATVLTAVVQEHPHPRRYEFALALAAIAWVLVAYWDTVHSITAIWARSDTFAHGYAIVPISAWLIWRRRRELMALDLRPNFMVLPLLAVMGFVWMLGKLAGVGVVQQYCIVIMVPLLVWTTLGNQVVRTLAFPLFFLLLAVPFGEFLLPPLMEQTASFTIQALRLSGIPVYREGLFFTVPGGTWSVIEACSGLRYLVASLTLGFLYAYLTYRSLVRRAIFVGASVVVPLVANWIRAYLIVMIGYLSDMKFAVGADHLVYGWLFFGVVMLGLFWIGSYWREDHPLHRESSGLEVRIRHSKPSLTPIAVAAVSAAAIVTAWPLAAAYLDRPHAQAPVLSTPAGSWEPLGQAPQNWQPRFGNPQTELSQEYADGAKRASLYIGYFRNQRPGSQLISSQNMLVASDGKWRNFEESRRSIDFETDRVTLTESKLRSGSEDLLVWHWYWIDGHYVSNPYLAKLLQAKSQLLGHGDDGAVIIVYTNLDSAPGISADRLRQFANAMLPAIAASLQHAR